MKVSKLALHSPRAPAELATRSCSSVPPRLVEQQYRALVIAARAKRHALLCRPTDWPGRRRQLPSGATFHHRSAAL